MAKLTHDRSHVALIDQLREHYTGKAKVAGSIPVQSLKFFSGLFFQRCYDCICISLSSCLHLIPTAGHLLLNRIATVKKNS